jgi:hypothetical protein
MLGKKKNVVMRFTKAAKLCCKFNLAIIVSKLILVPPFS